jgi:uncharacterized protein (DUF1800 family)
MLLAVQSHPAMLFYLDNAGSIGPGSVAGINRSRGLNENLAREILELHTLGGESARGAIYTQADVTEFARVLTGWRVGYEEADPAKNFDPAWHDPGRKTLLGKTYPDGPDALRMVLHDLALHPATARFIATKLARHFVADAPPPALVERLAATYRRHGGELAPVYRELIASPEAWAVPAAKLKTPEEFVISAVRLLQLNPRLFDRGDAPGQSGVITLGQRIQAAPSPAGWSDRADDWLGPDAVWTRVDWSTRTANRLGSSVDARALAARSLGPLLGPETRNQLDRAADAPQALALLLMAPEFQRR